MKTIRIKSYLKKGKTYEFTLGNGTQHEFTNLKDLNKFISETNKFLNQRLICLNELLLQLYSHTRQLWILNDKPQFDRTSAKYLNHIEIHLKQSIIKSSSRNGNYYSFIELRKAAGNMRILVKHLLEFETVKATDTTRRYQLNIIFEQSDLEYRKIKDYGIKECREFVNIDRYEDDVDIQFQIKSIA